MIDIESILISAVDKGASDIHIIEGSKPIFRINRILTEEKEIPELTARDIENIFVQEIPTLYMANKIGPIVGILFSVILIAGIYTTAVPLLWSTCNSFFTEGSKGFKATAFICCTIAFLGGKIPFSSLVNLIYPISGILGLIIIVGIFKKDIKGL